ncbi:MAG TPA: DUF305 domain-containing protein [Gemmatimonadales bacterium]|nr:DUF305 domain-containing protein [Gemmatimonadales bacterium]
MLFGPSRPIRPDITRLCLPCLLWLAACGGQGAATPAPVPRPSVAERVRADSLRRPYTEADVAFMTAMIGHHRQALVIAAWAATHAASPEVRRLADRIVGGQQDEIATMQQWLGDRGYPTEPGHAAHATHMPGMLTEAQLQALDRARGPAFDSLFLSGMIRHHQGAVEMVRRLFSTTGAAQDQTVFKFANDVRVDQATEIARMEKMLAGRSTDTLTTESSTQ